MGEQPGPLGTLSAEVQLSPSRPTETHVPLGTVTAPLVQSTDAVTEVPGEGRLPRYTLGARPGSTPRAEPRTSTRARGKDTVRPGAVSVAVPFQHQQLCANASEEANTN